MKVDSEQEVKDFADIINNMAPFEVQATYDQAEMVRRNAIESADRYAEKLKTKESRTLHIYKFVKTWKKCMAKMGKIYEVRT